MTDPVNGFSAVVDMGGVTARSVAIADSESLSGAVDLDPSILAAIGLPAGVEGDGLQIEASDALDGVYVPVIKAGAALEVAIDNTAQIVLLDPADFYGLRFIKFRSVTSGSPQVQTGAASLTLYMRP